MLALGGMAPVQAQDTGQSLVPPTNSHEAELRNLYTTEWEWRQGEFAREKVDGRWSMAAGRSPALSHCGSLGPAR